MEETWVAIASVYDSTLFPAAADCAAMNGGLIAGAGLTVAGLAGYAAGITVAFPGRAFSLPAIMTGITLVLVSRATEEEPA